MSTPLLAAFAAYLLAMLAIGLYAWQRTHSHADYVLGGRRLTPLVAALSAGASDMSGWLLLGLPGAVYAAGLNQAWIAIGLVAGAWLNWHLVAPRLRRMTAALGDALTLPQFLARRTGAGAPLRIVTALVILLFFTFYVAAGLVAGAALFESTFGLDYRVALAIGTGVVVVYTLLGGFLAVALTDVVQGLMMLAALAVAASFAIAAQGGPTAAMAQALAARPDSLDLLAGLDALAITSLLAWGLGYAGQPHILARFMALESAAAAPRARRIHLAWMVASLLAAVAVGLAGIGLLRDPPLADPETVFIVLTQALFTPWAAGFVLAAILAAIMSTIDSQLLVCASTLTDDLWRAGSRRPIADRTLVRVGRASVIAIALLAGTLALERDASILDLVAYAWAGFGAALGPLVLLALYWRRLGAAGAMAGLLAGAATVIAWKQLHGGWFDLYEIVPGFIACTAAAVGTSLLAAPAPAVVAAFDASLVPAADDRR